MALRKYEVFWSSHEIVYFVCTHIFEFVEGFGVPVLLIKETVRVECMNGSGWPEKAIMVVVYMTVEIERTV